MVSFLKRIMQAIRYIFDGSYKLENQDGARPQARKKDDFHSKIIERRIQQQKQEAAQASIRAQTQRLSKIQRKIESDSNLQERMRSWNLQHEAGIGSVVDFVKVTLDDVNAHKIAWHPTKLRLFILSHDASDQIQLASISFVEQIPLTKFVADLKEFDMNALRKLHKIVVHVHKPLLLFVFEKGLYIWNYDKQEMVAEVKFDDITVTNGGFYVENAKVWGFVKKCRTTQDGTEVTSNEWLIWDYNSNTLTYHQFQLPDNYKQNAILHPSGLIILNVIRHYLGWGFLYYKSDSSKNVLSHYEKPAAWQEFSDIDQPNFSASGRHLALISRNPHLTTGTQFPEILLFDFETAALKNRIILRTNSNQTDFQFGHSGKTLSFLQNTYLHIYSIKTQTRIGFMNLHQLVNQLAVHPLYGYYALVEKGRIQILIDETDDYASSIDLNSASKELAEQFIQANVDNLRGN